jgi:hypothetical protein
MYLSGRKAAGLTARGDNRHDWSHLQNTIEKKVLKISQDRHVFIVQLADVVC